MRSRLQKQRLSGTQKVIHDHATIGFVVTTDGSVTDLPRENYIEAEEKTVKELQSIGKPFLILLNCRKPYSEDTKALKEELEQKYGASVVPVNCEQMRSRKISMRSCARFSMNSRSLRRSFIFRNGWRCFPGNTGSRKICWSRWRTVMNDLEDIRSIVSKEMDTDSPYIREMTVGADRDGYRKSQDTDPV